MPNKSCVIQFCHSYDPPFLDCARQYATLFRDTPYRVTTVYLIGEASDEVVRGSASDEVIFLGYRSNEVRGLKLEAIRRFKEIIAKRDFCFCIAHRSKPTYIALLATRLPVISVHHAFGDYKRISRRLFANFFRSRLFLLGVSNAVRDEMRACFPDWGAEHIETLYNHIDLHGLQSEQMSREIARERLGLPSNAWVIGNVGRLHPDKDQATLIRGFVRALPNLPPYSLLAIMGSGPLEMSLKELAHDLDVAGKIYFLGKIPHGKHYFKAFDVFALTSDHEPFGMVLLEAMAAGVPVICSDCGGGREVVDDVGQLFQLGDGESLAEALVRASRAEGELRFVRQRMLERLARHFTDAAARQRFWSLPFISHLSG